MGDSWSGLSNIDPFFGHGKVTGPGTVFYKTGNMNVAQCHVARHSFMLATASR